MCGIGGPRIGQTRQHECRAVRGEVSAGCRKDLCLRSWKGHCREGRLWEDRGAASGVRQPQQGRSCLREMCLTWIKSGREAR